MLTNSIRLFFGCCLLGLLAGCASSNPYSENRLALEAANKQIAAGQNSAAKASLEAFLIKTNTSPGEFTLQRYFAAYLLSRASLEASIRARRDEWLAPLVGSTYYMNFAEEWAKAAKASAPASAEGEAYLPADLAGFGVDGAQSFLDAAWLIVCARTGFQGEVDAVRRQEPRLSTVDGTEKLCDAIGMSDGMRPWLMWSLFDFHKGRDEQLAYQFGIRARELGRKATDVFPAPRSEGIVRWILEDSKLVFKSSAGVEFDPGAEVCSQTGEANIKFTGSPK